MDYFHSKEEEQIYYVTKPPWPKQSQIKSFWANLNKTSNIAHTTNQHSYSHSNNSSSDNQANTVNTDSNINPAKSPWIEINKCLVPIRQKNKLIVQRTNNGRFSNTPHEEQTKFTWANLNNAKSFHPTQTPVGWSTSNIDQSKVNQSLWSKPNRTKSHWLSENQPSGLYSSLDEPSDRQSLFSSCRSNTPIQSNLGNNPNIKLFGLTNQTPLPKYSKGRANLITLFCF